MTDEDLQRMFALDGAAGPALPISAVDAAAIIDAALDGAGFGPGGGRSDGGGRASGGARGGSAIGGMKLAIVAAIAVVVIVIALLAWRGTRRRTAQLAVTPPDAAQIDAAGGSATIVASEPADAAVIEPTVPEDIAIDPTPTSPPSNPPRHAKQDRHDPAADDATDLLGEANAKRAAKQWKESDVLYARVVDRAPKSLAAQTALIASASLHLEHLGDPKGAAQRFRRALAIAPAGALAEEARWGIAEAARANHDATAEAAALDEFLAHHGQSPLAERARTRRAELQ